MNSEISENPWETAITYLFRPRLVLQGIVEYTLAWSFTRGWWRLLLTYSVPLLLLLGMVALVAYGAALSQKTLIERYDAWVTAELPEVLEELNEASAATSTQDVAEKNVTDKNFAEQKAAEKGGTTLDSPDAQVVSQYGQLLLRRLLQLQNSNSAITYLVAGHLARQNRLGQARQMMRRLAPSDSRGFLPAHAWLAADQLRELQGQSDIPPAARDRLSHDLKFATQWRRSPAGLFGIYAELLANQGDTSQAIQVLEQEGAQQSSMSANLQIAELAAKRGDSGQLRRTVQAMREEIDLRRENQSATASELAMLAYALLLEDEPQQAREIAQEGLLREPNNPQLLRMLSETYRVDYLRSISSRNGQTQVNLTMLDAALKADPSNPAVGVEIARLINAGQSASPELKAALEQQLAAGQATALTHILLANRELVSNNLAAAEPHLELALRQAPNNPTIMNNLALVLARTKPEQIQRALQLSMAACQAAPTNGQFRDTLGELRARMGDQLGAIESYEAAIGLDKTLISARQRLAELYRELGMTDMANVHLRELEKLRSATDDVPTDEASTDEASTDETSTDETSTPPANGPHLGPQARQIP